MWVSSYAGGSSITKGALLGRVRLGVLNNKSWLWAGVCPLGVNARGSGESRVGVPETDDLAS
jgi:hypothetical protein